MTAIPETPVPRLQAIDEDLRSISGPREPTAPYWAEFAVFHHIITDFLQVARLVRDGALTPYDPCNQEYSSLGPALVYVSLDSLDPNETSDPLVCQRITRPGALVLDSFQRAFVHEFQAVLAAVMAGMASKPRHLIGYASSGSIEQAIVGVLASFDRGSRSSLLFHQNLLETIRLLLLSTYEGEPARIAVLVIPSAAAQKLRWTSAIQDGLKSLREMKSARALSDGQDSLFAFAADGEFFGLFARRSCLDKLDGVAGIVEWQLRHALALSLRVDGQRRFELSSGTWRYVDDEAARSALEASDRCFAGPTRLLWELALRLAESRRGGLLLVVDDPAKLVDNGCCEAQEINGCGAPPRIAHHLRGFDFPAGGEVRGLALPPKQILLEQFRDQTIETIGIEVLSRLATVDGAVVIRRDGMLCGFGIILSLADDPTLAPTEGARTRAALLASKFGVAIKISEDGPITIYKDRDVVFA